MEPLGNKSGDIKHKEKPIGWKWKNQSLKRLTLAWGRALMGLYKVECQTSKAHSTAQRIHFHSTKEELPLHMHSTPWTIPISPQGWSMDETLFDDFSIPSCSSTVHQIKAISSQKWTEIKDIQAKIHTFGCLEKVGKMKRNWILTSRFSSLNQLKTFA